MLSEFMNESGWVWFHKHTQPCQLFKTSFRDTLATPLTTPILLSNKLHHDINFIVPQTPHWTLQSAAAFFTAKEVEQG
jgi:hypothetical protein